MYRQTGVTQWIEHRHDRLKTLVRFPITTTSFLSTTEQMDSLITAKSEYFSTTDDEGLIIVTTTNNAYTMTIIMQQGAYSTILSVTIAMGCS